MSCISYTYETKIERTTKSLDDLVQLPTPDQNHTDIPIPNGSAAEPGFWLDATLVTNSGHSTGDDINHITVELLIPTCTHQAR